VTALARPLSVEERTAGWFPSRWGPDDAAGALNQITPETVVAAAADVGNLRFYQRQGFRMRSIERDACTPATGYPPGISIDGIGLRDRVWLDRPVRPPAG
jgi:hypothetical protein